MIAKLLFKLNPALLSCLTIHPSFLSASLFPLWRPRQVLRNLARLDEQSPSCHICLHAWLNETFIIQFSGEDAKMHVSAQRWCQHKKKEKEEDTETQKEGKRGDFKEICQRVNSTLALCEHPPCTCVHTSQSAFLLAPEGRKLRPQLHVMGSLASKSTCNALPRARNPHSTSLTSLLPISLISLKIG